MAGKEAKADPKATVTKEAPAAQEKPKEPELMSLKDVAAKAGLEPREARAILRKLDLREEDQKRSRWLFKPAEVSGVVAKIKAEKAAKEKAKEEAAAASKDEDEDEDKE